MILFLTSSPTGAYRSNKPPEFEGFDPANGMVEELKRYWRPQSRCLLIAAFPDAFSENDVMRDYFEGVLKDTGLSAVCLDLCDGRNGKEMAEKLRSYDMIILGGGHVPTENAFFMDEKLRNEEKEDEVFEIMGDSVIVEVKDKTTGKVYRRELPIDFYENANVLRLLGENQDGSLSEMVFYSERGVQRLKDITGSGADRDLKGHHH